MKSNTSASWAPKRHILYSFTTDWKQAALSLSHQGAQYTAHWAPVNYTLTTDWRDLTEFPCCYTPFWGKGQPMVIKLKLFELWLLDWPRKGELIIATECVWSLRAMRGHKYCVTRTDQVSFSFKTSLLSLANHHERNINSNESISLACVLWLHRNLYKGCLSTKVNPESLMYLTNTRRVSALLPAARSPGRCAGNTCAWRWGCWWPPPPRAVCFEAPGHFWTGLLLSPRSLCRIVS